MIQLDYSDERSIYEQIVDQIESSILRGEYAQGERLPSVRAMAAELLVSPNTIQKAYSILENSGIIYSVRGQGSFVAERSLLFEQKREEWTENVKMLLQEGKKLGIRPQKVLQIVKESYRSES